MEEIRDKVPHRLLLLFARLYEGVTALRNTLYDIGFFRTYVVPIPIVCVGNLSVGGNAKTPLVRHLVKTLKEKGFSPVIVSRGYGGSIKGPHLVSETDTAARVGDEPLMLSQLTGVPVVIARQRLQGARYVKENNTGDVIVLDDGFQHRKLGRNVNILVANVSSDDAVSSFIEGTLLPAGNFREGRVAGLRRADMLVFADRKIASKPIALPDAIFSSIPDHLQLYRAYLKNAGIKSAQGSSALKPGASVMVITGIANPSGFIQSVQKLGFVVEESACFPDHYMYSQKDIDALIEGFPGIPFICTEKDLVKLQGLRCGALFVLRTTLQVEPGDAFAVQVMKGLRKQVKGTVLLQGQAGDAAPKKAVS